MATDDGNAYEQRRKRRRHRLQELADKAKAESDAAYKQGNTSSREQSLLRVSDALYTVKEVAAIAKCSPMTIKRQILAGKLKTTRIGSLIRISASEWEEYLRRSGAPELGGKFASTGEGELARLLRLVPTPKRRARGRVP